MAIVVLQKLVFRDSNSAPKNCMLKFNFCDHYNNLLM